METSTNDKITPLQAGESFNFICGPELGCFTDCCHFLDLVLSPYDLLRLRRELKMDSAAFLERYAVIEEEPNEAFPLVYLAMVDDGQASCPFLCGEGCTVYHHRPAACRAYPLGRGLRRVNCGDGGKIQELFILVREDHCRGFTSETPRTPESWMEDQGLEQYNRFSDALHSLLRHPRLLQGWQPGPEQKDEYLQTLYNLEDFRRRIQNGEPTLPKSAEIAEMEDEDLLLTAVEWLTRQYESNTRGAAFHQGK